MKKDTFSIGKSYNILEKEYTMARDNLLPYSYHFLMTFSEVALSEGRIRRSIELTREALMYAHDANTKAEVYLKLARLYRMLIQMQNTRSELKRGFKELGIEYPKSGLLPFLSTVFLVFLPLSYRKQKNLQLRTHEEITREELSVALYLEAALSVYYMTDPSLVLLQISLRVRQIISRIGPSTEMLDYLAATATMFAIYDRKFLAYRYLSLAKKVCRTLHQSSAQAKYRGWEILMVSYLDNATKSAELSESLLKEQKADMSLHNLRLISTTLSTNYTLRGKMSKAINAIDQMMTPYDRSCTKVFSCNKTFIEWYKIPALVFLGDTDEVQRIVRNSQAIFSSVDEEKWQLTLFLGNMLMYYYVTPKRSDEEIKNIFERFDAINITPKKTFLEAQHFWVSKAYLLLDIYVKNDHVDDRLKQLIHSVAEVKKNIHFKETKCHYLILQAHIFAIRGLHSKARKYIEKGLVLSKQVDNDWAHHEAEKLQMRIYFKENETGKAMDLYQKMHEILAEKGWKGYMVGVDAIVHTYTKT